jgi:hypothetical protein
MVEHDLHGQMIGGGGGVIGVQRERRWVEQVGANDLPALEVRVQERVGEM